MGNLSAQKNRRPFKIRVGIRVRWVGTRTEPLRPGNRVETGAGELSILFT